MDEVVATDNGNFGETQRRMAEEASVHTGVLIQAECVSCLAAMSASFTKVLEHAAKVNLSRYDVELLQKDINERVKLSFSLLGMYTIDMIRQGYAATDGRIADAYSLLTPAHGGQVQEVDYAVTAYGDAVTYSNISSRMAPIGQSMSPFIAPQSSVAISDGNKKTSQQQQSTPHAYVNEDDADVVMCDDN